MYLRGDNVRYATLSRLRDFAFIRLLCANTGSSMLRQCYSPDQQSGESIRCGSPRWPYGGSNVVGDAGDDGNGWSTAQSASGLRGTPPSAIVYAVLEFIWGMSD